jgi:hypothetical protein
MITKDFVLAKTFRAYSTNFLRQEKSFRDHALSSDDAEAEDAFVTDGGG